MSHVIKDLSRKNLSSLTDKELDEIIEHDYQYTRSNYTNNAADRVSILLAEKSRRETRNIAEQSSKETRLLAEKTRQETRQAVRRNLVISIAAVVFAFSSFIFAFIDFIGDQAWQKQQIDRLDKTVIELQKMNLKK